ncbi:hypothetical protein [Corynebacterium cystitidis]|uniref:hypothetical protein n=1 Tax=Corynebacterium cystitidis TaxID=35757 RepID=UPI00211F2272|nr:hypothetical protein [Corynebacterium cystitidis]
MKITSGMVVPGRFPGSQEEAENVINNVLNLNLSTLKGHRSQVIKTWLAQFTSSRSHAPKKKKRAMTKEKFVDELRKQAEANSLPSTLLSLAKYVDSL